MQNLVSNPYAQELSIARKAAAEARIVLTTHFGKLANVEEKFMAGLVSEADRNSEETIKRLILQDFPEHDFLGEEGAYLNKTGNESQLDPLNGKFIWVCDPLDGTTNYVHRFPIYCSSIALVKDLQPVVAVIDVPALNETYSAVLGGGAFCNGNPIHVSKRQSLKSSLVATGFFADHAKALDESLRIFSKVIRKTRGVRRAGAAAFDLCMVASGVFDAFWERNLSPWDTAAGQLLVTEAGGEVCTYRGNDYHPWKNSILAATQSAKADFLNIFNAEIDQDTD